WQPIYRYIYASTEGMEDQSIYFEKQVLVFPSNYMLKSSFSAAEDGYVFNVEGYGIDFSAVDSGQFESTWNDKLLRGQAAELNGHANLYQVEYKRNKTGEYYDFINKVTIDKYEYEYTETVIDSFDVQTENGFYVSPKLPYPTGEHAYYYIELNVTAPDGQWLREICYTPGDRYYYWNSNRDLIKSYSFRQSLDAERVEIDGDYYSEHYDGDYFYSSSWNTYRSLNEAAPIQLIDEHGNMPAGGRMLYTVVGTKLFNYKVRESMDFSVDFLPQYCPNVRVLGAYFDGRHIFTVDPTNLNYHFQDSELILDVTADKERYLPGEEVSLRITVKDSTGTGHAANYLVSVADEAAFAVMDQEVKLLKSIYDTNYIYYDQFASYKQPYDFDLGAESGEGGGSNIRRDFVDTVAFVSGQTDQNGHATIQFKLPDNLTSWRLTSIAFYEDSQDGILMPLAGKNTSNISCSLPFFINQVLNGRYLAGESIGLSLRGAGSDIKSSDMVSYEARLSGTGVDISQKATATAGDFLPMVFDSQPAGEYTLSIKAVCGNYSDALELPVNVVESLLTTHRQQNGDLSGGLDIQARRFPVHLTLYDMDNRLFYDTLNNLLSAYGQRADQILVRALAGQRLNALTQDSTYPDKPDITAEEQNAWRYGLRLFPYAEADTLLTAKAVAVAGQFLDGPSLADYFRLLIDNKDSYAEDVCAAYLGLAALREPVLLELRNFFAAKQDDPEFELQDRLHLAIGLALLGDHTLAKNWYETHIHSGLKSQGATLSLVYAEDAHYNYTMTAEAAMLATLLNHADHRGLLAYVLNNRSATYAPLLELAAYIGKYDPKPQSAAAMSYYLGGQTIDIDFAQKRQVCLELGEEQLNKADFKVSQGNVGYSVYYFGGLAEANTKLPPGVSISRSLSATTLKMGESLKVTTTISFDNTAEPGIYHLAQVVPTGLRFENVPSSYFYGSDYTRNWYYRIGEMGLIDFYIYPLSKWHNQDPFGRDTMPSSVTFSYTARAVLPGTYIMEADAVSFSGDNTLYATERNQVMVEAR
ncbi:MAG: hypothetical protein FWG43_05905, partial [Clostridiales bacterium]|nr:hypothetical protein [Clostridiales bacterium]